MVFSFVLCGTIWICRGFVPRGTFYRPNLISNTFTSAGETPGTRDACPIVSGRMRDSFWRASIVSAFIE